MILRRVLVASRNPGKLREFGELLAPLGTTVLTPGDRGWSEQVEETGETLEANALLKARAGVRATGEVTLADDSGLFVDALGGAPGVHSARYAGPEANSEANCATLLSALEGVPPEDRGAEFRCRIALVAPGGSEHVFSGTCRGRIATAARGAGGFGYDPLFEVPSAGLTFAEMSAEQKHEYSHRARALNALQRFLTPEAGEENA